MLQRIEKYELLEELGHGGMATVYRAHDTRLDRDVAIKVMHPHLRSAREARARFTREAKTIAKLRHPNILEIFDYSGEDSDESYIAAELLTGPTLRRFADTHAEIPAEIAACFAIEIARALEAAHAEGIVHRDVKPENVLIHEARCVKLTDFGIAHMLDAQSMTATGQVLGSPGHMAPEQIDGRDCDPRTDLFALGTVLYLLATGKLPFTGRNPHHTLKRIAEGDYADPLRVRPTIGATMRAIIQRLLARDPAGRYPSARALIDDLTAFVRELGIDDPARELARYLADVEGVSTELRRRAIEVLPSVGESALARGDIATAQRCFDRVLALDECNARVLAALDRMGASDRRRGWARRASAAVAVAAVVGVVGWLTWRGSDSPATTLPTSLAPMPRAAAPIDAAARRPILGLVAPLSGDAATDVDAGFGLAVAPSDRPSKRLHVDRVSPNPAPTLGAAPREVVFRVFPANVSIAVDDAPARPYGPSFQSMLLPPGPHRFRIRGALDCCVDQDFTLSVPAGEGPFALQRRLAFRPASLYVVANAAGNVIVGANRATGRTRAVMQIAMSDSLRETVTISVTAPGHRAYTGTVMLQAGQLTEHRVELRAEPLAGTLP